MEIPPHPTRIKSLPCVYLAAVLKAFNEYGFNGAPDNPPVCSVNVDDDFSVDGLWIVVFDTIIPLILDFLAELTIDWISDSFKSGAILTKIGVLA